MKSDSAPFCIKTNQLHYQFQGNSKWMMWDLGSSARSYFGPDHPLLLLITQHIYIYIHILVFLFWFSLFSLSVSVLFLADDANVQNKKRKRRKKKKKKKKRRRRRRRRRGKRRRIEAVGPPLSSSRVRLFGKVAVAVATIFMNIDEWWPTPDKEKDAIGSNNLVPH